jgi:hypothetical protein
VLKQEPLNCDNHCATKISNCNAYSATVRFGQSLRVAHIVAYTQQTHTHCMQQGQSMYKLKLVYDPEPRTQTLKETVTYCASIELYTNYRIECYQTSASELCFESDRDRTLALLYLTQSTSFTPLVLN